MTVHIVRTRVRQRKRNIYTGLKFKATLGKERSGSQILCGIPKVMVIHINGDEMHWEEMIRAKDSGLYYTKKQLYPQKMTIIPREVLLSNLHYIKNVEALIYLKRKQIDLADPLSHLWLLKIERLTMNWAFYYNTVGQFNVSLGTTKAPCMRLVWNVWVDVCIFPVSTECRMLSQFLVQLVPFKRQLPQPN